jgi:uncharacterized RmlC-like cupin family protein
MSAPHRELGFSRRFVLEPRLRHGEWAPDGLSRVHVVASERGGAMSNAATPTCKVVRADPASTAQQGTTYASGISAESVGAQRIWLGLVTLPPGARTKAHRHQYHESAFYVLSGAVDLWHGEGLRDHDVARGGDFLYIPAGVSHVAVNRSDSEPCVFVGGRTDAHEQEGVVMQPELDARVP